MMDINRLKRILRSPAAAWARYQARNPETVLQRHARNASRSGIKGLHLLLAFDCDTDRDAEVVQSVHNQLQSAGIMAVYAVPGILLERHAAVYRTIAATGAEFINHGYAVHAERDPISDGYQSTGFYDQMDTDAREQDIRKGHDAVCSVLGKAPSGFRTPHFGTFQEPAHLAWLYRLLSDLGYRFSSSTMPLAAFRYGPLHRADVHLWEFPLSGWFSAPKNVLDTYSFRAEPGRTVGPADYLREFQALIQWFQDHKAPGIINLYADPSQVFDWPEFMRAMSDHAADMAHGFDTLLVEAEQ